MTAQELLDWLKEIPEADRQRAEVCLECGDKWFDLTTAKFYDGKRIPGEVHPPSVYLISK